MQVHIECLYKAKKETYFKMPDFLLDLGYGTKKYFCRSRRARQPCWIYTPFFLNPSCGLYGIIIVATTDMFEFSSNQVHQKCITKVKK